jgi:hypothetical protein
MDMAFSYRQKEQFMKVNGFRISVLDLVDLLLKMEITTWGVSPTINIMVGENLSEQRVVMKDNSEKVNFTERLHLLQTTSRVR